MEKQRILIVNKFYYRRGGDCVCTLNLERLLRQHGHETAVFAMEYGDNLPSEWSGHFAREVNFGGGIGAKLKAVGRTLGYGNIRKAFNRVLDEFRPDVVHLQNIHSYLSPVVAQLAHDRGIRVVWTLHDYKLICPSYACLRDGKVCELCYTDKSHVLKTRCMKGSLAASAIAWMEARKWNRDRLQRITDTFICPSRFMAGKMEQAGFDPAKLHTLCNFVDPMFETAEVTDSQPRDYYCYIGRLSDEKGVATLIEAASRMPYTLKIAGTGPMEQKLRAFAPSNVKFLGRLDGPQILELLQGARFSVIPSEWYENNPLGVIESLSTGTPVIGARIGGIPELITEGTGDTFTSGDAADLARAIRRTWNTPVDHTAIRTAALARFSSKTHYNSLLNIYSQTI